MNNMPEPAIHAWTARRQPTFSETNLQEKGNTVKIVLNNLEYTVGIDPETGYWEWTPPFELPDGEYLLSVYVIDKAMNNGIPRQIILHVDTTAPETPEIMRVIDDAGSQQGWLSPGAHTDDRTPLIGGHAEAGSLVHLYDGDILVGSARVNSAGGWEVTPEQALPHGEHYFTATSTDGLGHVSPASAPFTLTVDVPEPAPVIITHASDNAGVYQGVLTSGALTDDITPDLHGRAEAHSVVWVHYRTVPGTWELLGSTLADSEGNWLYAVPELSAGCYEFQVVNTAERDVNQPPFALEVMTGGAIPARIEEVMDDAGFLTGPLQSGAETDDQQPVIRGKAEAHALIEIAFTDERSGQQLIYSTQADSAGCWTSTPPTALDPGDWQVNVKTLGSPEWQDAFSLTIKAQLDTLMFSEDFSAKRVGSVFRAIKIDGAMISFSYDMNAEITETHGSRHFQFGSTGSSVSGKMTIDLDYFASYVTFRLLGVEDSSRPAVITALDKHGEVIETLIATQFAWQNYMLRAGDRLISQVVIEVENEFSGIDIDDIAYEAVEYKRKADAASLHGLPCAVELADESTIITADNVLQSGGENLFISNGKTQLMVNGNEGDVVQLADILPEGEALSGWTQEAGTVTVAGIAYNVYSNGEAELLVQEGVKTELV